MNQWSFADPSSLDADKGSVPELERYLPLVRRFETYWGLYCRGGLKRTDAFTRRNSNLKVLRESCIDSLFYCGKLMTVTETLSENLLGANCPFIALNSIWGVTSSLIPQYLRERSSSHHPRVAGFLSSGSHTSSLSLAQFCEGLSSPIAFHRIVKHQAQQELSVEFHCFFFWFNVNLSKNAHGPWCISVSLGDEVKMCLVLISGPSRGQLKTHYVRRAFEKPHSWSLAGIRHFQK